MLTYFKSNEKWRSVEVLPLYLYKTQFMDFYMYFKMSKCKFGFTLPDDLPSVIMNMKPKELNKTSMTGNDTNPVWSALKVKVPLEAQEGGASGVKRRGSLGKWAWLSVCKRVNTSLLVEPVRLLHRRQRLRLKCRTHKEHEHIYQQECWTEQQSGRRPGLEIM